MNACGFKLRTPCEHCPFRLDVPGYLRYDRCVEIARSLADGAEFPCHKTTVTDPDDESENTTGAHSQWCAGALIVMERTQTPNQAMRIAERLNLYHPARLDMQAPVARSFIDFAEHHGGETDEPCCIANPGCLAPAGYMVGGIVVPGERDGGTFECTACGQPVCDNCSTDDLCADCAESED